MLSFSEKMGHLPSTSASRYFWWLAFTDQPIRGTDPNWTKKSEWSVGSIILKKKIPGRESSPQSSAYEPRFSLLRYVVNS